MRRKAKKSYAQSRVKSSRLIVFGFVAACVTAFVSMISLEMGASIFAVSLAGFVVMLDRYRRKLWEQATDFKLKTFGEKHDSLAREVIRNRNTLEDVRDDVMSTKTRVKAVSYQSLIHAKRSANKNTSATQKAPLLQKKTKQKPSLMASKPQILKQFKRKPVTIDQDHDLSDMVVEELISHAVQNRKVDVFLQPVIKLPQRSRAFYEVLGRIRAKPGVYVAASRYTKLAKNKDFMRDIDALLLGQVLTLLEKQKDVKNAPSFFLNVSRSSLKDKHFMSNLLSFIAKHKSLSGRLILEMSEGDFHALSVQELQIVSGLSRLGLSMSLDHVESLDRIDIPDLQRFDVRYLKINAAALINDAGDEAGFKTLMKAKRALEGNGVAVIGTRIEDETSLRRTLDFDLRYGQGFLFGRPDTKSVYAGAPVGSKLRKPRTTHG